jgi:hypothetical protein
VFFCSTARSTTRLVSYLSDDQDEDEDAEASDSGASDDEKSPPFRIGGLVPDPADNVRHMLLCCSIKCTFAASNLLIEI